MLASHLLVALQERPLHSIRPAQFGSRGHMNGWQVNLWGLDAIKTKGESVAVALYMVGARPVREGTGRIARSALLLHPAFSYQSGVMQAKDDVNAGAVPGPTIGHVLLRSVSDVKQSSTQKSACNCIDLSWCRSMRWAGGRVWTCCAT